MSQDVRMDPNSSEDSDIATSRMMTTLTMHSRKASATSSLGARRALNTPGHTSSDQDSDLSPTTFHSRSTSASRKRPRDVTADVTTKLNEVSDTLVRHIQDSSLSKIENKRLRIESKVLGRELKARETRAEREHELRTSMAAQTHERAMADEKTRQLELELKLEQVKLERERLAMEKSGGGDGAASYN
jgi:hypothetical protein